MNAAGGWGLSTWHNMERRTFLCGGQFRSLIAGSWGILTNSLAPGSLLVNSLQGHTSGRNSVHYIREKVPADRKSWGEPYSRAVTWPVSSHQCHSTKDP